MGDAGAHVGPAQCRHDDVRPGEACHKDCGNLPCLWTLDCRVFCLGDMCCIRCHLLRCQFTMLSPDLVQGGSVDDVFSATYTYMKKREAK